MDSILGQHLSLRRKFRDHFVTLNTSLPIYSFIVFIYSPGFLFIFIQNFPIFYYYGRIDLKIIDFRYLVPLFIFNVICILAQDIGKGVFTVLWEVFTGKLSDSGPNDDR